MEFHAQHRSFVCIWQMRWWHFHNRRCLTICVVQLLWWRASCDVIWSCVMSTVYDCIPCLTLSYSVCYLMVTRACHILVWSTVCVVQELWLHATPDVLQSFVLSKGNDGMPCVMSNSVLIPRSMISSYARCRPVVCVVLWLWCNTKCNIVHVCV